MNVLRKKLKGDIFLAFFLHKIAMQNGLYLNKYDNHQKLHNHVYVILGLLVVVRLVVFGGGGRRVTDVVFVVVVLRIVVEDVGSIVGMGLFFRGGK